MSGPILFVSCYADPKPVGSNCNLATQARALQELGYRVEILTWPFDSAWLGPIPDEGTKGRIAGVPYLCVQYYDLQYHVVTPPHIWSERVMTEQEWEDAVAWAMQVLKTLRPTIIHQHFWQNLWYFMDAAIRLQIPTIYTAHDHGIACPRTLLVTGEDSLCDAKMEIDKCSRCILAGRNLLGKANEYVASLPLGPQLLSILYGKDGCGALARRGGVRLPVRRRVAYSLSRCNRIIKQLDALIVANPFACRLFQQFGLPENRTHVMPWYSAHRETCKGLLPSFPPLVIGFVGRISPEKGVHILLQALEKVKAPVPIILKIAGSIDSKYAGALKTRYPDRVGSNQVVWLGWIPNSDIPSFYKDVHVIVVPSLCYEATTFALVDAISNGRPVICTDMPSMTHLVQHEVDGLVFPMGDVNLLAAQIRRFAEVPDLIQKYAQHTCHVMSVAEYAQNVGNIYMNVIEQKIRSGKECPI